MLAARGSMVVSGRRYRRCGSVGRRIDVAPSQRVDIKHPHPSHLFYSVSISPFATKKVHPLPNCNSCMSRSGAWDLAILSLSQARHAFIVHLSVIVSLLLQRQRHDMDLIACQLPILVLSAKDVRTTCYDSEGVV